MLAGGVVGLQAMRSRGEDDTNPTASVMQSQSVKPYHVLSSEVTTFGEHTKNALKVQVSPFAGDAGVVSSARDIGREHLAEDPTSITDITIYTADNYLDNPNVWAAHAVVVISKRILPISFRMGSTRRSENICFSRGLRSYSSIVTVLGSVFGRLPKSTISSRL